MSQTEMFDDWKTKDGSGELDLSIIPVSVIDIAPQKKRECVNHDKDSSRASYSPFPKEVTALCYEFYLKDCKSIFDPFAGWGERHAGAVKYGKEYVGYDTSEEAIKAAKENYGVENDLGDSEYVPYPRHYDGVITCPPYWNLEQYAGKGIDRLKTWEDFKAHYCQILIRVISFAESGSVFCIMTGDWRHGGKYYDLTHVTDSVFKRSKMEIIDKLVISRKTISKIKVMLPQAKRLGYSVRVHESLHVFRKP